MTPYPTVAGLFGKPTLVSNVETLAIVPLILNRGAAWYRRRGTLESPGWVLVTLGQEVNRPGVYEVPHGTTLRKLIFDYGGGPVGDKDIKAILPGGPSLPFLRATDLDVPIDHESLKIAGSGIGCGAIRIWLEDSCMMEATLRVAEFFAREQCGLCPSCCMETNSIVKILTEVSTGHCSPSYRAQIEKAVDFARGKGRCSLINMAAAPVVSALSLFEEDFRHHVEHGRCRFTG